MILNSEVFDGSIWAGCDYLIWLTHGKIIWWFCESPEGRFFDSRLFYCFVSDIRKIVIGTFQGVATHTKLRKYSWFLHMKGKATFLETGSHHDL